MSLGVALLIGFAGSFGSWMLTVACFSDFGKRWLPSWTDSFGMLLFLLALNCAGWIVALIGVS